MVGYALKVKRHDGSMVNPWKVRVTEMAKTNKAVDSMNLAKNARLNNRYEISLNIGNDKTEEINAILPLFDLQDG